MNIKKISITPVGKRLSLGLLSLFICCGFGKEALAQKNYARPKIIPTKKVEVRYGPIVPCHRTDAAMEAFRNYGLGQFIHWGMYAIPANEWEGHQYHGASEWIRSWSGASKPERWELNI